MGFAEMIATRKLPDEYAQWNARWGAPFGRRWLDRLPVRVPYRVRWLRPFRPWVGMFGFQINNSTREYEYPWCFHATPLKPGMRVLEIGGSLAGFQFVLSSLGLEVVNVDPGEDDKPRGKCWPLTLELHDKLNRSFGTSVTLRKCFIEEAGLDDASFDRVFAISVLEHIPQRPLTSLMSHVHRVLKPDGLLVATVDLFLDAKPFTEYESNAFGTNVDIRSLVFDHGFELIQGEPSELHGFGPFEPAAITRRVAAGELLKGNYPALAQCFACRKKA
jgi:SAM-dependent methyltransferase